MEVFMQSEGGEGLRGGFKKAWTIAEWLKIVFKELWRAHREVDSHVVAGKFLVLIIWLSLFEQPFGIRILFRSKACSNWVQKILKDIF